MNSGNQFVNRLSCLIETLYLNLAESKLMSCGLPTVQERSTSDLLIHQVLNYNNNNNYYYYYYYYYYQSLLVVLLLAD